MITHITTNDLWKKAEEIGIYNNPSIEKEGFIHCSDLDQVVKTANRIFKGNNNLLLLYIDETKVKSEVKYEDLYNEGEQFPHIYGALNIDAVIKVENFIPKKDGTFEL